MRDAQAVTLGDKLFLGGGKTSETDARLYVYFLDQDSWNTMDTKVCYFALTTYHSQLVLVGGVEYDDNGKGTHTNKLWALDKNIKHTKNLPPMRLKRCSASAVNHGHHLVVAGGENDVDSLDIVEVFNGHHWVEVEALPYQSVGMKSAVLDGIWYLMGGHDQDEEVYCVSLDSLITSRSSDGLSVWKMLPNLSSRGSSPAVLGKQLVAVGGGGEINQSSTIYAYSFTSESWINVWEMPVEVSNTCTIVLPGGELMVIGGWPMAISTCTYKIMLEGEFPIVQF